MVQLEEVNPEIAVLERTGSSPKWWSMWEPPTQDFVPGEEARRLGRPPAGEGHEALGTLKPSQHWDKGGRGRRVGSAVMAVSPSFFREEVLGKDGTEPDLSGRNDPIDSHSQAEASK